MDNNILKQHCPHCDNHPDYRPLCRFCKGTGVVQPPEFDGTYPTPEGKVAGHVPESEGI